MTNAPTTRETADHAELAANAHIRNLRLAASRDFAVSGYSDGLIVEQDMRGMLLAAAEAFDALLSEIAALRGERSFLVEQKEGAEDAIFNAIARATQAERQRDELRKAMPDISSVIAWLDNGCEPKHAVTELSIYKARIDQALASQGADQ